MSFQDSIAQHAHAVGSATVGAIHASLVGGDDFHRIADGAAVGIIVFVASKLLTFLFNKLFKAR